MRNRFGPHVMQYYWEAVKGTRLIVTTSDAALPPAHACQCLAPDRLAPVYRDFFSRIVHRTACRGRMVDWPPPAVL